MYRILCKDKSITQMNLVVPLIIHNFYFQQLAENGLIGFFVFYIYLYIQH